MTRRLSSARVLRVFEVRTLVPGQTGIGRACFSMLLMIALAGCTGSSMTRALVPDLSGDGHLPTQWEPDEVVESDDSSEDD